MELHVTDWSFKPAGGRITCSQLQEQDVKTVDVCGSFGNACLQTNSSYMNINDFMNYNMFHVFAQVMNQTLKSPSTPKCALLTATSLGCLTRRQFSHS